MARTIGEVDFIVDFDGRALPQKARRIGEQAGRDASKGFRTEFDDGLSGIGSDFADDFRDSGDLAGINFTSAMEDKIRQRKSALASELADVFFAQNGLADYFEKSDDVDSATVVLREKMRLLRQEGGLDDKMWERLGNTLNRYLPKAREIAAENDRVRVSTSRLKEELYDASRAYKEINVGIDDHLKKLKAQNEETKKGSFHWSDLSHNLRQAILIVAAVAAGMQQIAVLGSAAGAGLTIFAAAAVGAVIALIPLIIGFADLEDNMKKLSPGAKAAAEQFGELKDRLGDLQLAVQDSLLDGLAPALVDLGTKVLPVVEDGLVRIAGALNLGIGELIARLSSDEGLGKLETIFANVEEQVPHLVAIIGNVGSAIANILIIAQPYVMQFLGFLTRVTAQFDRFTGSAEGKNAISEWFSNGVRVLSKFGDLLAATGKLFAGVVDEEAVQQTERFLDNLSGAMPFLQDIIEVLGELDIFGIIAAVLNDVGNALSPLLDLLKPIASIIGDSLMASIQGLGFVLELLLAPLTLLQPLLDGLAYWFSLASQYSQDLLTTFQPLIDEFENMSAEIGEALKPAIEDLIDSFFDLLPSPEEMARIIQDEVIPAMEDFTHWIIDNVIPAIKDNIEFIKNLIDSLGGFDGIKAKLAPFVRTFQLAMIAIKVALAPVIVAVNVLITALRLLGALQVKPPTIHATGNNYTVGGIPVTATGKIVRSAQMRIFGEDGAEAIVPLQKPLSQVDPEVRPLAAFAQGKLDLSGLGGGRTVNIAAGAIVISDVRDGRQAARAALDEITRNL